MGMIILHGNKGAIIPNCKLCGQKMLPKNSDLTLWKCPDCKKMLNTEEVEFLDE